MVARLTLDQLIKVRILVSQSPRLARGGFLFPRIHTDLRPHFDLAPLDYIQDFE